MKSIGLLLSSTLLGFTVAISSSPRFVQRDGKSCNFNAMSCKLTGTVDSCCSPVYGMVAFSMFWAPQKGANTFTTHGLWPSLCTGDRVPPDHGLQQGCSFSTHYTQDQITSIIEKTAGLRDEMDTFWPSDSEKYSNEWLWWHEWDTHGTCVSTLAANCSASFAKSQNVIEYYKTSLALRKKYDIYEALSDAQNMRPGSSADTEVIRQHLERKFGVSPKLDCDSNGYLYEIIIYFNVKGKDTYMPIDASVKGSCPKTTKLPTKKKN